MKFNLNEMRRYAGLPLVENKMCPKCHCSPCKCDMKEEEEEVKSSKNDASPEHEKHEKKLFDNCISCCDKICDMAEKRLAQKDLSEEHRKQYKEMCSDIKKFSTLLKKHLASYK